QLEGQAL
ncbi:hypothetical protein D039_2814B, partial [Vibrio parahaemolyticus EKP-028]